MKNRKVSVLMVLAGVVWSLTGQAVGLVHAQPNSPSQAPKAQTSRAPVDPLKSLTSSFPKSIRIKQDGHLLEFCPDNTCDGFVSTPSVPVAELKDFAYLYIFYFSDFVYLPEWRSQGEAKDAAERLLSRPEYRKCKAQSERETARCVLLERSHGGRIRLIFVRYDENQRNVVPEDISKELSEKPASTSP